jgi:hypothetical protein
MRLKLADFEKLASFIDGECDMKLTGFSIRGLVRNIYISLKDHKILVTFHWTIESNDGRYRKGTFKKGDQHKFEIKKIDINGKKAFLQTVNDETLEFVSPELGQSLEGPSIFTWIGNNEENSEELLKGVCAVSQSS